MLRIREKLRKLKEDPNTRPLDMSTFNFAKSREALKHYKGNLSDAVREERDEW